jgi:hypothetical protein
MAQRLPLLPLGRSNFAELIQNKAVYVDKTMYFPNFLMTGKYTFCARPRRFGKSLTVSTLEAFYSGKTELFKGLAVEKHMCSPNFVAHPVVRLDMSAVAYRRTEETLIQSIMNRLGQVAKRFNISLHGADFAESFSLLLNDIHEAKGIKPILLIDEYDAPVIVAAGKEQTKFNRKLLDDTRDVMRSFYAQIKIADDDLKHAFITGITKFTRMGVFFQLNNLEDISLSSEFSALMGYTQKELETHFAPFITAAALKLSLSEESLLDQIREYYNGFSFDGEQLLYNPFSILSFFRKFKFSYFWMTSGSNTFIRKYLMHKAITVDQFQNMVIPYSFADAPGEIESTPPHGFLYQAGYLTLRVNSNNDYTLIYPNLEVRESIAKLFMDNVTFEWVGIDAEAKELFGYLLSCDVQGMIDTFARLFVGICFKDHLDANRSPVVRAIKKIIRKVTGLYYLDDPVEKESIKLVDKLEKSRGESFYRSLLQACLWMAGAKVTPEKKENIGKPDLEVCFGSFTYVFEVKMAKNANGATAAVREGMNQIHERGYGLSSKDPIFVSIAVGKAERNIVGCLFEKGGQETSVEIKIKTGHSERG